MCFGKLSQSHLCFIIHQIFLLAHDTHELKMRHVAEYASAKTGNSE